MTRHLVLHIGNPKAGSSSLQSFFYNNREDLAGDGILYPIAPGEKENSHAALPKSFLDMKLGPNQGKMTFNYLREVIAESAAETFVVSSEFFVHARWHNEIVEAIEDLARECDLRLTIIALVRPQTPWMNSAYTQNAKQLRVETFFRGFVAKALKNPLYDLPRLFDVWQRIRGGTFIALPFSTNHLKPGLASVFMQAAGLPEELVAKYGSRLAQVANTSPGVRTVAACRIAALMLKNEGHQSDRQRASACGFIANVANQLDWNATPFLGITDEIHTTIRRHFEKSNDRFAGRVWGKRWDEVFPVDGLHYVSNELRKDSCSDQDWHFLGRIARMACNSMEKRTAEPASSGERKLLQTIAKVTR